MEVNLTYTEAQEIVFFNSKEKYIIVPKGRRAGMTKGGANAFIDYALQNIYPLLWVDTINSNIDRYVDRYFIPELKKNNIKYEYKAQQKILKIGNAYIDFRSAENPENIEGFGYKKIFLNEAGIILNDDYLYTNAILPMLLDYSDSQLFACGVPKGKINNSGQEHRFYSLYKRATDGNENYKMHRFTPFNNPFLKEADINALITEMDLMGESTVKQEIYAEFIDENALNPFIITFEKDEHESTNAVHDPNKQLRIIFDFNMNPFCFIFAHIWRDNEGEHCHVFDEVQIKAGSIPSVAEYIKTHYGKHLPSCLITGDSMGNRGDISQRDNANLYLQLTRLLNIRQSQIQVPNNPTHENSRADCNYIFKYFPDFKINPIKCPNLIRDIRTVQCDAFGSIIKKNRRDITQQADLIDCLRYLINTWLSDWVKRHRV